MFPQCLNNISSISHKVLIEKRSKKEQQKSNHYDFTNKTYKINITIFMFSIMDLCS